MLYLRILLVPEDNPSFNSYSEPIIISQKEVGEVGDHNVRNKEQGTNMKKSVDILRGEATTLERGAAIIAASEYISIT